MLSQARTSTWTWLHDWASPSNRVAVLVAWAAIHTTVVLALIHVLDSEVARGCKQAGLQAPSVQLMLVLLTCNTCMYLGMWVSDPGVVKGKRVAKQQQAQKQLGRQQHQHSHEDCSTGQLSSQRTAAPTSVLAKQGHSGTCQRRDSSGAGGNCSGDNEERWSLRHYSGDVEAAGSAELQQGSGGLCRHCGASPPLRSKHCRHCRHCIRGFDHHCYWVGTCIGANNHARFWAFLGTQTALLAWGVHQALTALRHQAQEPAALAWHSRQQLTAAVLTMFLMLVFLVVGGLLLLHSLLMVLNQTTFEAFERNRVPYLADIPHGISPFDKGPLHNVWHFFFARDAYDQLADLEQQAADWQAMSLTVLVNNDWYSCC